MTLGALMFALLVATGAGFRLGYERHVLSYGRHDPDRLIWLAFAAALFLAVLAWPIYELYDHIRPLGMGEQRHPPFLGWVSLPVAVALPWMAGDVSGRIRRRWPTNRPAPRRRERNKRPTGFDFVMQKHPHEKAPLLWIKLKEDAGKQHIVIGRPRHASPIPYPQDVYLEPLYFHGTDEELEAARANKGLDPKNGGILVRFDDILFTRVWRYNEEGEDYVQVQDYVQIQETP